MNLLTPPVVPNHTFPSLSILMLFTQLLISLSLVSGPVRMELITSPVLPSMIRSFGLPFWDTSARISGLPEPRTSSNAVIHTPLSLSLGYSCCHRIFPSWEMTEIFSPFAAIISRYPSPLTSPVRRTSPSSEASICIFKAKSTCGMGRDGA